MLFMCCAISFCCSLIVMGVCVRKKYSQVWVVVSCSGGGVGQAIAGIIYRLVVGCFSGRCVLFVGRFFLVRVGLIGCIVWCLCHI